MEKWPVCFSDLVIVGNPHSSVAIVTLWTKKEFVLQHLSPEMYALVGQLYSRDEGVNGILRNLLSNKQIRHLIVVGIDLNGSGNVLAAFFQEGVAEQHTVISFPDIFIDKEIPLSSLELLRNNVQFHDLRSLKDFSQLPPLLHQFPLLSSYGEPEYFAFSKPSVPATYPSEKSGFFVRHSHIGPAWLEILSLILRFGTIKKSDYGVDQRELLNIISVIEQEDPDAPHLESYFQFTREDLLSYYPQVLTASSVEGVEYSYGERLRANKNIDQIQQLISLLQKNKNTRRALAVTWDLEKDSSSEKPPCLILTEFLVQDDKLFLTAFFRSNDMFHAWPRNAFGLRKIQFHVAAATNLSVGSLTIISSSAHLYQNNWTLAQDILSQNALLIPRIGDPRGNIIIRAHDGVIYVTHTDPLGKRLSEFSNTDIFALYRKIAQDKCILDTSHALYLGTELQKAAIALQKGIVYVQDKPLEF
ncbi:hypothetical protein HZA99_04365 [Candidatus Woesearchaeota archaeon]|nr:hypothetical protein [Candidatus Woesearchaeota archaeon]